MKSIVWGERMEAINNKIRNEKNKLSNNILIVFSALGTLAVMSSIYRTVDIGWQSIMWLYLFLLGTTFIFAFLRKSIPFELKVFFIIIMTCVAAIAGLSVFGLIGSNAILLLAAPIMATVLISLRAGVIIVIISAGILIITGAVASQGFWKFEIDSNIYLYSFSSWIVFSVVFLCFSIISIMIVGKMNAFIYNNLKLVEKQREELEIANATKDKIFSVIAHDLTSPFNGYINMMQLLCDKRNAFSEEKQTQILQNLCQSSKNTFLILENLLTWSRAQMGNMEIKRKLVNANSLPAECFAPYLNNAENKNIKIEHRIPEDMQMFVDEPSIRIVLSNLINNAIKFTEQNGIITLSGEIKEQKTVLTITDTGVGISKSDVKRLFDNNDHMTTLGTNNEKGTGLGLKLCYELVQKNNGEISVESIEGEGSTFCISFQTKEPDNNMHTN